MKKFYFWTLMSGMTLILLWLGGFIVFNQFIGSYKIDYTTKTDAIVVLTGGKNRLAEAMKLYNDNLADILIISGVAENVTLSQLERQNHTVIENRPDQVILGNEASNTIENAIEVSEAVRRNNVALLRLVTSYYHMPRSEQEILLKNPDVKIVYHPVYSENVSDKWWKKWGSFCLIAMEYNKFIFVYVKNFVIRLAERD